MNRETAALVDSAPQVRVRKARVADVPAMATIINGYASQGQMLPKSQHQLYQTMRDFVVAESDGTVVGCGALHVVWADLAEVRSLAVAPQWRGRGVGWMMLTRLLDEARDLGLPRVFALTYHPRFFARAGFQRVAHESLPHKIWGDCLNCPKYPNCDEVALMLALDNTADQERKE